MLQSVFYRVFLLLYALMITQQGNGIIPSYGYYIAGIVYFVVYLILKKTGMSLGRLIADIIFINLVVYGRDVKEPITFLFILLPLINAINFSGKNSHNILLLVFVTITFAINLKPFENWILLPLISLWLLYYLSWILKREWETINSITLHIDTYFINQEQIERPHRIYQKIIADVNQFFWYKQETGITQITAYILRGHKLWLINSSAFTWNRTKSIPDDKISELKDTNVLKFKSEDLDEYFFYIHQGDLEYVFVCETKHNAFRLHYRFCHIMLIAFSKVALLLNSEFRISEQRNKKFDEIKDNVLYVKKAVRIMHFIRNRMTPLTNIIEYYKKQDTLTPSIRSKMDQRMKVEVSQAESDLKEMLSTANYLLDKSNNPFVEPRMKNILTSKVFIILSEIVERLLEGIVEIDESIYGTETTGTVVHTSLIELKIMFTDWVNNIRKYMNHFYQIRMSIENTKLVISFLNDYNTSEDNIQRLIRDMNSKEKDAVLEGKDYGYGIYIIKSIANHLDIDIKAEKKYDLDKGSLLYFELKLNTYEKDSDI